MMKFILLTFVMLFGMCSAENYEPVNFWLSWMRAPQETMTVRWLSRVDRVSDTIEFREKGTTEWSKATGNHIPIPYNLPYLIHTVELTSLKPQTPYEFRFSDAGKVRFFRTMPEHLTRAIRFADGGDMYHDEIGYLKETMRQAAAQNPDFVIAGGDLAYSAPSVGLFKEDVPRWFTFLKAWQSTMVAPDGRIIPMVPLIGNHEVIGRYGQTPAEAEFYYSLFVYPASSSYYVLDFGDYMSLILLDSGHTNSIDGTQAEWLKETLESRKNVPHKFASYHVPAYPSVRKTEAKVSARIRENWVPIFENAGLTAAFEHHDHAYKRTFPLFQNKIDEERGVIYLGDGAFGVKDPREPKKQAEKWFIEKAVPSRHFILITLKGRVRQYQAITDKGEIIDNHLR